VCTARHNRPPGKPLADPDRDGPKVRPALTNTDEETPQIDSAAFASYAGVWLCCVVVYTGCAAVTAAPCSLSNRSPPPPCSAVNTLLCCCRRLDDTDILLSRKSSFRNTPAIMRHRDPLVPPPRSPWQHGSNLGVVRSAPPRASRSDQPRLGIFTPEGKRRMRGIHSDLAACIRSFLLIAAMAAILLAERHQVDEDSWEPCPPRSREANRGNIT
jgi:hypothetical protein